MIIYLITNNINKKQYVGQTVQKLTARFTKHKSATTYLGNSIRKYGEENFSIEAIDMANSKEELDEKEKYWIAKLNTRAPNGMNLTDGGEGVLGREVSLEERKHLSKMWSGSKSPRAKKVVNLNTGKIYHSIIDASKDVGISKQGIGQSCLKESVTAAKCYWAYHTEGMDIGEELKKRNPYLGVMIIELNTRKVYKDIYEASAETGTSPYKIKKICNKEAVQDRGNVWRFFDDKIKYTDDVVEEMLNERVHIQKKPVINLDTLEIFESIAEVGKKYNVSGSSISLACKGKQKTSIGYRWAFYEDYLEKGVA